MTGIRLLSILVGAVTVFAFEYGLGARWYVSLLLGLLAYLAARYVGWAVNERRRFKQDFEKVVATKRPPEG
jgi:hypothetical protein